MNEEGARMVNGLEIGQNEDRHGFLCHCPACLAYLEMYTAQNASDYFYDQMVDNQLMKEADGE